MTRAFDRWIIIGVIVILACGLALISWTVQLEDDRFREDLLIQTRLAAIGIDPAQVAALRGSGSDLASPDYLALKTQMARFRTADPDVRFTYLIGKRTDDTFIFYVDSESPESADYSPPGQEYPEITARMRQVFSTGIPVTEGPDRDRWGTWISGIVPVRDPETGKVIAIFGMDVDGREWDLRIARACLPIIIATLVLLILLLGFFYAHLRDEHEKEILEESHRTLRESEHRLNDIINFLPDAVFVINAEGRVISWNKAIENMTGVRADDILGKGNYEYALPFYSERRPVLINLVLEPDNEIAKKYTVGIHRQGDLLIAETDTELVLPDGTRAFLAAQASPLRDVEGNITGAIESIRDMTYRKKAEIELRTSEERLRLLLQNINEGILVHRISKDGPGAILDVNDKACHILGYSREELMRMSIKDIDVPEQQSRIASFSGEILSRKYLVFETEYFSKDRQRIPVEINARLFELEGTPAVLAIFRDITERKLIEREMDHYTSEMNRYTQTLQQVNDKLNLMNRITRHDILNQLTAIIGYLDIMQMSFSDPKLQEYLAIELRAAKTIQDQILFTKEYQDIGSQKPKWFDLRSVIESAAGKLTLSGIKLGISIEKTEVYADPLFEKVFYTLIENATRHGEKVTEIRFSARESVEGLTIVYEDNGAGVPAEYKLDIFNQKYFKHTGFGLFLSRTILGITGISIAETGIPGEGARFEILVPKEAYRFRQER